MTRQALIVSILVSLLSTNATASEFANPIWERGFNAVYDQLEQNLSPPDEKIPFYHAHPAPKYPAVYLWDSAFISLIWKNRNPAIAKDIIRSVLFNQRADGRVPHQVNFFGESKWTQPPLLSYAAAKIATASADIAFAKEVYPKLRRYEEWLWKNRRLANGLFFWQHPYESGMDNSPRFSNRDESEFKNTTEVAAIDLNSYVVVDAESMQQLALLQLQAVQPASSEANALLEDLRIYKQRAEEIKNLTREFLWDKKSGYFYDRNVRTGEFVSIPTIASFFPLFAGIPTYDQWLLLREHLVNPAEFNTPIPLPTVARNAAAFEKDCWRGPVWINTAFMVIQGIHRYQDPALAKYFSRSLVDGVYNSYEYTGEFVEFYDPEHYDFAELTRKHGLGPMGLSASGNFFEVMEHLLGKQIFLGDKPVSNFVGWTGLVNNLALEEF